MLTKQLYETPSLLQFAADNKIIQIKNPKLSIVLNMSPANLTTHLESIKFCSNYFHYLTLVKLFSYISYIIVEGQIHSNPILDNFFLCLATENDSELQSLELTNKFDLVALLYIISSINAEHRLFFFSEDAQFLYDEDLLMLCSLREKFQHFNNLT